MLYTTKPSGEWRKMQLSSFPQCALFEQTIITSPDGSQLILVQYHAPKGDNGPTTPTVQVPLEPDISNLEKVNVDLHGSPTDAYRVGSSYDEYFTLCLGIPVILVYIGDGKRAILGKTLIPKTSIEGAHNPSPDQKPSSWISSLTSYITTPSAPPPPTPWITFTDVAPFLVASEASLHDVSARIPGDQPVQMYKFRPNIIVDGAGKEAWDEDFWAELTVTSPEQSQTKLQVMGNCVRCTSLNVDYDTGKPAEGEMGTVLKKLMKDRRVDPGMKWSPVFGRYAALHADIQDREGIIISVGDEVEVTGRNVERSVWDWPL